LKPLTNRYFENGPNKNPTSASPFTLQPRKMRVELLKLAASNHIFKEVQ
jgi:hypothetical protein